MKGYVAKTDGKTYIVDLNDIDVSNYDRVVELMQYEGQRFNYKDKEVDDIAVRQGIELPADLGKTKISKDSKVLKYGNEVVSGLELEGFRDNKGNFPIYDFIYEKIKKNNLEYMESNLKLSGFGSVYLGVYFSGEKLKNNILISEPDEKYRVLYLNRKLNREYNRIINLPEVKKGFENNIVKVKTEIEKLLKNINLENGEKLDLSDKYKEVIKEHVNLTFKNGFS